MCWPPILTLYTKLPVRTLCTSLPACDLFVHIFTCKRGLLLLRSPLRQGVRVQGGCNNKQCKRGRVQLIKVGTVKKEGKTKCAVMGSLPVRW